MVKICFKRPFYSNVWQKNVCTLSDVRIRRLFFYYWDYSMSIILLIYKNNFGVHKLFVEFVPDTTILYILFISPHGGSIIFVRFYSEASSDGDRDFEENNMYVELVKVAVKRFYTLLFRLAT